jgi:hypothetical protein
MKLSLTNVPNVSTRNHRLTSSPASHETLADTQKRENSCPQTWRLILGPVNSQRTRLPSTPDSQIQIVRQFTSASIQVVEFKPPSARAAAGREQRPGPATAPSGPATAQRHAAAQHLHPLGSHSNADVGSALPSWLLL